MPLCPLQIGLCVLEFDSFTVSRKPPPLPPWRSCLVVHCLPFFSTVFSAGVHYAVINTNVTCHCAGRPQNRSSPGRKSLWWTENRKKDVLTGVSVYIDMVLVGKGDRKRVWVTLPFLSGTLHHIFRRDLVTERMSSVWVWKDKSNLCPMSLRSYISFSIKHDVLFWF